MYRFFLFSLAIRVRHGMQVHTLLIFLPLLQFGKMNSVFLFLLSQVPPPLHRLEEGGEVDGA